MLTRISAFIAILFAPALIFGQALADHVPADAMVYVGWRGVSDLGPGYAQSNLKAVLDASEVRQFISDFLPTVVDRAGQQDQQAAAVLKIVGTIAKPSWQRPTAFFFAGIDMPQNGPPIPHLGLIWQPGADADTLQTQLKQLTDQLQPPFPVKIVHVGELVALMVGYDNPEAALTGDKVLAQDSAFKTALSQVNKDPVMTGYVDFERLINLGQGAAKANDPNAAATLDKVLQKTGLSGLKRIIATSGFDGKDWGTSVFIDAPEPRAGLLSMTGKPLDEKILSLIPKTATMAGAGRADLSPIIPSIRDAVREFQPAAADQLDQVLKGLADQSGVDIEKDLIGSLGDGWAYFTDPSIGGQGLYSMTLVNHLKDPARFEQAMSKIEDFTLQQIEAQMDGPDKIHLRFQTTQIDGLTVHYLATPLVSPSWVVHDGTVYLSAFPQVAAAAAKRGADVGTSILQNAGFIALRQRLGHGSEAIAISFDDLPQTAPQAYGVWLMVSHLTGFGDLFGIKSPPLLLPPLQKLAAHLSPAGSVKWADAKGIHVRSIESFPGSTLVASDPAVSMLYAQPLLLSTLLPALNKAREQANRIKSASNLRQIGLVAIMYANNHKGNFPADLPSLVKEGDLAPSVFCNPGTATAPPPSVTKPDEVADWVKDHSDYVYVGGGKKIDAPADVIVAYEKISGLSEGINVLYADGAVKWLTMAEAMPQIEKIHGPQ